MYSKLLFDYVSEKKTFVRTFYGKCKKCGVRIWSVGEDVAEDKNGNPCIKARFVCDCGAKYKEVVFKRNSKKYKYPQALPQHIEHKKYGNVILLETVSDGQSIKTYVKEGEIEGEIIE